MFGNQKMCEGLALVGTVDPATVANTEVFTDVVDMGALQQAIGVAMLGNMAAETIDFKAYSCDSDGNNAAAITGKAATQLAAHASNNFAGTLRRCGAADALTIAATTFTTTHASEYVNITAHGLQTGDGPVRLTNSGGALPAGFALATDYYVIVVDANTLQLASTRANAFGGTAVTISGDGTGTHTITYTG